MSTRPGWPDKPIGKRHSEFVLGRTANKEAFEKGEPFVVSAFKTYRGKTFYSSPVGAAGRMNPGPGVLYRIRVTPKLKG